MDIEEFERVGVNHVRSIHGFEVQRTDRFVLIYSKGNLKFPIEVEFGLLLNVYLTGSAQKYNSDAVDIEKIRNDLVRSLTFMKVRFEII